MKKGDGKVAVTFFRWSPDWEAAAPYFEQAANEYRRAKDKRRAKLAFEKASLAQEKCMAPWPAAKHLETAGGLAKESGAEATEIADFYRRANNLYCEAGRAQSGADALCRGAKALEPLVVELAVEMYMEACEQYENEEKEHYAGDAFRAAIAAQVEAKKFADAAGTLMRFAVICEKLGQNNSMCKAYLGAVVVLLYAEDAAGAQSTFNDCVNIPGFSGSDEANAAEDLIDAYSLGKVDGIRDLIKRTHTFEHLDTVILRLVRKLPLGDVEQMSRQLKGRVLQLDPSDLQLKSDPSPPSSSSVTQSLAQTQISSSPPSKPPHHLPPLGSEDPVPGASVPQNIDTSAAVSTEPPPSMAQPTAEEDEDEDDLC